jgi:hypothetical protein
MKSQLRRDSEFTSPPRPIKSFERRLLPFANIAPRSLKIVQTFAGVNFN